MIRYPRYFYFIAWNCVVVLYGCFNTTNDSVKGQLTFNRDIAPIIYRNCSPCHHPGSAGPFNLLTYEDVKQHAATIKLTIKSGFMPPWPADTSYSHFLDEKKLTQEEVDALCKWMDQDMTEGDANDKPVVPEFHNSLIGKPDYSVTLTNPVVIKGDNLDRFYMMKVPLRLAQDTFVQLIEIIPGNPKLVHHINGHLVQYENNSKHDLNKGAPFVNTEKYNKPTAYTLLNLANDDGTYPLLTPSVTNYLPGVESIIYPDGIGGYRLKKNSVLLLDNIHYGPSPIDTSDQTTFNFFFMPYPPKRPTHELILGTSGISTIEPPLVIAPGKIQHFTTRYILPQDISLLTINPHMHLLGSVFKAYALTTLGDTIPLIRIPKWDFRWQYFYTFKKPIHLEAGWTLVAEGTYDNTENNPLNPFFPPRQVAEREGSMRTTDEMFQLICTWIPYQTGDENISLKKGK